MSSLIEKIVLKERITDKDIENELFEICDRVHSSCDESCPVYHSNGGYPVIGTPYSDKYGCDCFKDGKKMRLFVLSKK
jgi:hypothetical protein